MGIITFIMNHLQGMYPRIFIKVMENSIRASMIIILLPVFTKFL